MTAKHNTTQFRTRVILSGKAATGIEVPSAVVDSLRGGNRPPVRVRLNDHTYRSTVARMGGVFMLPISAQNRQQARVAAGDLVRVSLTLDTDTRQVDVPQDLKTALALDRKAREEFDRLSHSKKQRLVIPIQEAKTTLTRDRRVAKAVHDLHDG